MDEQTDRRLCYGAMAALLVILNYLTTGLALVYIATLRPTDIGRRVARTDPSSHRPIVF